MLTDAEGVILDQRAGSGAKSSLPPGRTLHQRIEDAFPPGVGVGFGEAVAAALETGRPQRFDYDLETADGRRDFEARVNVLQDRRHCVIIVRDITARRQAERALEQERFLLGERVKEQQCLYDIFHLTDDPTAPIEDILLAVVNRIPAGLRYPELASALVTWDEAVYASPGFSVSDCVLSVDDSTGRGEMVRLTFAYGEIPPSCEGGPFLPEETFLAQAIVHRLTEILDRRATEQALLEQKRLLDALLSRTGD
ncbi:PAS domain-containing protein [Thiohalocapsa marina]|uniref:PAS domain-containing protein n=1 Tax=Thiohalocapsa marina TaxID=424902 RepID=UPI00248277BF|nr:PAS domain-containing protein [Thiohalocapsa marina]